MNTNDLQNEIFNSDKQQIEKQGEMKKKSSLCIWLLFLFISLINAFPIFYFRYVPFQDHPSHLLKANIIRHYGDRELRYFENFEINKIPVPNILTDYLTAGISLILPIDIASRLVIGFCVFLLPLSLWFWISRTSPGGEYWASLSWIMVWSKFLFAGNENFCFVTPILFYFWGILSKWDGRFHFPTILICILLSTLIYFGHFLVFLLAGLGVLIHIFTIEFRSLKVWLTHILIPLPGILLTIIWFSNFTDISNELPTKVDFSPITKISALSGGISPFLWDIKPTKGWWLSLLLAIAIFVLWRAIVSLRKKISFAPLLIIGCFLPAILLPEWFLIFIPNQRIWWIIFMCSLCLLPPKKEWIIPIWFFTLVLFIGTSIDNVKFFKDKNKDLFVIDKVFSRFPKNLRLAYMGQPHLLVHLHRCFEYYHIRSGGVGLYHIMGESQSVKCKNLPTKQHSIYDYGPQVLGEWLDNYDAILIVAPQNDMQALQSIEILNKKNYRMFSTLPYALLIHP